jgi:hypothetical protein
VDGIVNTLCHLLDHLAEREHAGLLTSQPLCRSGEHMSQKSILISVNTSVGDLFSSHQA